MSFRMATIVWWIPALLIAAAGLRPALAAGLEPKVQAYFEEHCIDCHGPDTQKGDFRIDTLSAKVGFENSPQWLEVMSRITSGEMPPKRVKVRPSADDSATVVEWISSRMKEGEAARLAARPLVSYDRLTREEYVNTVRDLLGIEFNATDPGAFLEEPEWHGFERIGSVLTLSPANIEKYLAAAETILDEAFPANMPAGVDVANRIPLPRTISEAHRARLAELGLQDKARYEMWPGDTYGSAATDVPVLDPGVYEISFKLSGLKPEKGRAPRLFVYETKLDRVLHEQDVIALEDKPTTVTFRAHLPKGRPTVTVINEVPGPSNAPRSGRHGNAPFVSIKEGRLPWQVKLTDEQGRPRYPFLILDSVSWRGPIVTEEQEKLRDQYMPTQPGETEQLRQCLGKLAHRAFRRPVSSEELDAYIGIVKEELAAGEKFPEAVKAGMAAILCSKSFVFMAEGDPNKLRHTLNDWEIASRLSYLLWSTMPDDPLFDLAEAGKLHDKAELGRQVARMLADPRSDRFVDSFATQWLRLRKVGMFPPDKKLYPDYDKQLEQSMIGETKAFVGQVLRGGLTLREFLTSDWSMMNARLAEFYGLPDEGLPRDDFERVSLPAGSHRGGLLTQAAILSLTSDGTRERPVHRGVWVSEAIFGKTPPPPPANVDPIAPNPVTAPKATIRMKIEAHIHDARCAACHAKIDPLGLAFENFDAIGRWRDIEKADGVGPDPVVNASGQLPDGRKYKTPDEFKQLLVADLDAFNATFIEKLATYGMRRTMSFDDRDDLKKIAAASKEKNYCLHDLVAAFVCSDLFQKR
jgi:mono/diheme cytochrome c family protein